MKPDFNKHQKPLIRCSDNKSIGYNILNTVITGKPDFNKHQKPLIRCSDNKSIGYNMLLIGPPGSGKTMLSERLPSIMPPLTAQKALERASIYSIAGKYLELSELQVRPFRSPHHSSSAVALVGGGTNPKPGEISLAHKACYF